MNKEHPKYDELSIMAVNELRMTMDNWRCLDKELVNKIVDEYMERLEVDDDFYYLGNVPLLNWGMFVADIKREILSRS